MSDDQQRADAVERALSGLATVIAIYGGRNEVVIAILSCGHEVPFEAELIEVDQAVKCIICARPELGGFARQISDLVKSGKV